MDQVYFAEAPSGLIKIGHSSNVPFRMTTLLRKAEGKPRLLIAVPGVRRHEGRVHAALIEHHVGREWFEPAEKVMALISALRFGFLTLDQLPDRTSPILRAIALRTHAVRRERLLQAA
jgi:hypothetical protein